MNCFGYRKSKSIWRKSLFSKMSRRLTFVTDHLLQNHDGNVAVVFAVLSVVLLVVAGGSLDIFRAFDNRVQVQEAADAAAIAAVKTAQDYIGANGWTAATIDIASKNAVANGKSIFTGYMATLHLAATPSVTITMTMPDAQHITADVVADVAITPSVLQVTGIRTIPLQATATATIALPTAYYQFVFLIDVSGSMAAGATAADNTAMVSTYNSLFRVQTDGCIAAPTHFTSCSFACHDPNAVYACSTYPDLKNRRVMAANKGISLKIDYAKTAVAAFLNSINSAIGNADAIASIYSYATNTYGIATKTSLTTATSSVPNVQIETIIPSFNWGYTYTSAALTNLAATLTNVGDGTTAAGRRTFVVFISDGLEDTLCFGCYAGRSTGVAYGTSCSQIKATGSTLIAVQATYPVVSGNDEYTNLVSPWVSQIPTAMRSCASSAKWYFVADDGPGIATAMGNAFQQVANSLRLAK